MSERGRVHCVVPTNPNDGEVCGNGVDDDADGSIDAGTCGNARITFVIAAANAYLDLQRDRNVDVGVMTFNQAATLDRAIDTLNAGNIGGYKSIVDSLLPGGNTGIGDALNASTGEFTRVAALGRSRTAYLMTDGYNTSWTGQPGRLKASPSSRDLRHHRSPSHRSSALHQQPSSQPWLSSLELSWRSRSYRA